MRDYLIEEDDEKLRCICWDEQSFAMNKLRGQMTPVNGP